MLIIINKIVMIYNVVSGVDEVYAYAIKNYGISYQYDVS